MLTEVEFVFFFNYLFFQFLLVLVFDFYSRVEPGRQGGGEERVVSALAIGACGWTGEHSD
jgi:hypothetical protein